MIIKLQMFQNNSKGFRDVMASEADACYLWTYFVYLGINQSGIGHVFDLVYQECNRDIVVHVHCMPDDIGISSNAANHIALPAEAQSSE